MYYIICEVYNCIVSFIEKFCYLLIGWGSKNKRREWKILVVSIIEGVMDEIILKCWLILSFVCL